MFEPEVSNLRTKSLLRTLSPNVIFGKTTADSLESAWDRTRVSILDLAGKVMCKLIDPKVLVAMLEVNLHLLREVSGKPSMTKKETHNISPSSFKILTRAEAETQIRQQYIQTFCATINCPISKVSPSVTKKEWPIPLDNWTLELATAFGRITGEDDARVLKQIAQNNEHFKQVKLERELELMNGEKPEKKSKGSTAQVVSIPYASSDEGTLFSVNEMIQDEDPMQIVKDARQFKTENSKEFTLSKKHQKLIDSAKKEGGHVSGLQEMIAYAMKKKTEKVSEESI